jgi:hypothetical protein
VNHRGGMFLPPRYLRGGLLANTRLVSWTPEGVTSATA